jgi:hypothetical protein
MRTGVAAPRGQEPRTDPRAEVFLKHSKLFLDL